MGWVALQVGGGMGFRIRLHEGRLSVGGQGWVPAYARTTDGGEGGRMVGWVALRVGGGMGFRIRLRGNNGTRRGNDWWSRGSAGTTDGGMDPRIREDKGEGWVPPLFTGASSRWEDTGGCTPILTFPP